MISNKTNKAVIHEILEDFTKKGVDQLKDSLERLFDQLMIADARRLSLLHGSFPDRPYLQSSRESFQQTVVQLKLLQNWQGVYRRSLANRIQKLDRWGE